MTFLHDHELAFITGKGGVGRTTVALAVALAGVSAGRRVVLCELAGQSRAARLYGLDAVRPGREARLEDGLWATTIDPVLALEEWAARQIGSRRLIGLLTHSGTFASFVNATPGARELVSMAKAWELGRDERWVKGLGGYDLVVVDGPASGHGVGMLRTPRTFAEIARVGPIASQARKVAALLEDPGRSAVLAVAHPAELAVSETIDLEARIAGALGRPLDTVVVNGLLPRRFSAGEVARLVALDGALPAAVVAAARRQHGQAAAQQGQLRRLRRHVSARVATLPHVATPHLTLADVRTLAAELARRL
jgi:anion-transporting  ArsA/GET3 family ATPase